MNTKDKHEYHGMEASHQPELGSGASAAFDPPAQTGHPADAPTPTRPGSDGDQNGCAPDHPTPPEAPADGEVGIGADESSNLFSWEVLATGGIVLRDAEGEPVKPEDLAPGGRLASSGALIDAAYEEQVSAPRKRADAAREAEKREAIARFRAAHPDGPPLPTMAMAEAAYEAQARALAEERENDELIGACDVQAEVPREHDAVATFMVCLQWRALFDGNDYGILGNDWGCVTADRAGRLFAFQNDVLTDDLAPYKVLPEFRDWLHSAGFREVGFGVTACNGPVCWGMLLECDVAGDDEDACAKVGAWLDACYAKVLGKSPSKVVRGLSIDPPGGLRHHATTGAGQGLPHGGDGLLGGEPVSSTGTTAASAATSVASMGARLTTARRKGESPTVDETPRNLDALRTYSSGDLTSVARDVGVLLSTGEAWVAWESMGHEDQARHVLVGLQNWDEVVRRGGQHEPH